MHKVELGDDEANLRGRFRSHSLLASLIYNFAPPPPPPPPAAAPAAPAACHADVPGRFGDPGDGRLPGTAATARLCPAASAGAGA